jgi:multidrug efflux pump subunit AcrA (membrane-fusion protein)
MVRWITIILCVAGIAVGVLAVMNSKETPPVLPLARPASVNPFDTGLAALGIVEPLSRDIGVVAPEPGLVVEVLVDVGTQVEAGQTLFRLDDRLLRADLIRAEAAVAAAESEIARWHSLPRAEDLPPLEAALAGAAALVADREEILRITREAVARGSGNVREVSAAQFALDAVKAQRDRAAADLAREKAGGWKPDLDIFTATLAARNAEVQALKVLLDRLNVRAPRAGMVLRRELEAGEFASTERSRPAMIIGDLARLAIRAQVDEEDIALVGTTSRAIAKTRGARPEDIELKLVRVEPFARPKSDLGGDNMERTDTRVIDVVFEVVTPPKGPLFPGQAVDVFIEAGK